MTILRKLTIAAVAFAVVAQPMTEARANTATSTIAVSATVLSLCTVAAAPLAFGNYQSSQVTANTSLTVLCTSGTTYTVALNAGTGTGATTSNRLMTGSSGGSLQYALYSNSAMTSVWGNTTGTNTVAGTGTGLNQTLTVYGQIPGSQYVAPGAYTDTVTVTLTY